MSNSLLKTKIASIAACIVGSFCLFVNSANANLFVSPLYLKMESEKGQSKGVLQIGNTSSQPIRVRLSATAFTYDRDGSFRRLESNGKSQGDLTPYLRYSPREMIIPANSSRRVRVISLLPPSLPEGEYRTAIFAETLQSKTSDRGYKIGLNLSVGSALYVAKGETEAEIEIADYHYNATEKKIELLVTNNGSATAKGKINWTLKQDGEMIVSGESGSAFLPKSKTNIVLNRSDREKIDLASGKYQLEGQIVWDKYDRKSMSEFRLDLKF